MHPDAIQQLLLTRAVEETDLRGEHLAFSERETATREALAATGNMEPPPKGKPINEVQWRFLAARAARLHAKAKTLIGEVAVPLHPSRIGTAICAAAMLCGFASHMAGLSRTFDLLALPLVLILVWNAVVYGFCVHGWIRKRGSGQGHGILAHWVERKLRLLENTAPGHPARRAYVESFAAWLRSWATPTFSSWFHAGSACFVFGLLAAIYLRGLNQEYFVAWESTWLDARSVGTFVGGLLAPASWLSGIPLPDSPDEWNQLKRSPGHAGGNAGPWIHLYAITLIGWVVLPRLGLAAIASARAKRMRTTPPGWHAEEPYVRRILGLARQDGDFRIAILPFDIKNSGMMRDGAYRDGLERLVRETWGQGARPCWLEAAAYGEEDGIFHSTWADAASCDGALLLLDIHATPEDEVHGALLDAIIQHFGGSRRGVLTVLETTRFEPSRTPSRQALWQELAGKRNINIVPVHAAATVDPAVAPESRLYPPH